MSPSARVNSLSPPAAQTAELIYMSLHQHAGLIRMCVCICVYVCLWDWQLNSESQPMEKAEPPDDCLKINPLLETPLKRVHL